MNEVERRIDTVTARSTHGSEHAPLPALCSNLLDASPRPLGDSGGDRRRSRKRLQHDIRSRHAPRPQPPQAQHPPSTRTGSHCSSGGRGGRSGRDGVGDARRGGALPRHHVRDQVRLGSYEKMQRWRQMGRRMFSWMQEWKDENEKRWIGGRNRRKEGRNPERRGSPSKIRARTNTSFSHPSIPQHTHIQHPSNAHTPASA